VICVLASAHRVAAVAQWLPVADVPELVLDFAM
jgi:hypothetical protein